MSHSSLLLSRIRYILVLTFILAYTECRHTHCMEPATISWGGPDGFSIWGTTGSELKLNNTTGSTAACSMPMPAKGSGFVIVSRTSNLRTKPVKAGLSENTRLSSPPHGIRLSSIHGDTLEITLSMTTADRMIDNVDLPTLTIKSIRQGVTRIHESLTFAEAPLSRLRITTTLRISAENNMLVTELGDKELKVAWSGHHYGFCPDSISYILSPGASIKVMSGAVMVYPENEYVTERVNPDSIRQHINMSTDMAEGEWVYLDRVMDESLLRMGGEYRLLTLRNGDGYNIYYLAGADINPGKWHSGELKGRLLPDDNVSLRIVFFYVCVDVARGDWMQHNLNAVFEQKDILTLQFPYQSSSIRFLRVR